MYERLESGSLRIEVDYADFDEGYLDSLDALNGMSSAVQFDNDVRSNDLMQEAVEKERVFGETIAPEQLGGLLGGISMRREIVIRFAKCIDADPEIFFPKRGGSTKEAKRICGECPVRTDCLELAIDDDERFGVWGGYSEQERKKLKRQRRLAE